MRMIDPTYLRNIHDSLMSGDLHKDNASSLPHGLVGMYEEALPPSTNVNERNKFLEFFAVWALLKKEVSVAFLMTLLEGWSEETIIYYINKYSKWFNASQSGKYLLYHERLRAFILKKISKQQFNAFNETIIKTSNDALSRRSGDEWEHYALEYLSNHMLIPAIEKGDASVLKLLAYNTTHWNRQVEISKGFEWSKRMLNDMMLWASKFDDEEVIECALNKVDLHHQEQNDAQRIVELVAQNDIETALDRIDKFGGQDKEGLQRKFILYMLCLMELTLLDSKDKMFRKEAIEKLLKHLDENLPVDHSVLNWNDFFPSYLMFQMACELYLIGIDFLNLYKQTNQIESGWLNNDNIYINDKQYEALKYISDSINKQEFTYKVMLYEVKRRDYNNLLDENEIKLNNYFKALLMIENSKCLNKKKLTHLAEKQLNKALCIYNIDENKINVLSIIGCEYFSQGNKAASSQVLSILKDEINSINNKKNKSYQFSCLIDNYLFCNEIEESLLICNEIKDAYYKFCSMLSIVNKLNNNKENQIENLLIEAFKLLDNIEDEFEKGDAQKRITKFKNKQFGLEAAILYAKSIELGGGWFKDDAIGDLAIELIKDNEIKLATDLIKENKIIFIKTSEFYKHCCNGYLDKEDFESAVNILPLIVEHDDKKEAECKIANRLICNGEIFGVYEFLIKQLDIKIYIQDEYEQKKIIRDAIICIAIKQSVDEALIMANKLLDSFDKCLLFLAISNIFHLRLRKQSFDTFIENALNEINLVESEMARDYLYQEVIKYLLKIGEIEKAKIISNNIEDELDRFKVFLSMLSKNSEIDENLELKSLLKLSHSMVSLTNKLLSLGLLSTYVNETTGENYSKKILEEIFIEINDYSEANEKSYVLAKTSTELFRQAKFEKADSLIRKVIEIADEIEDVYLKNTILKNLCSELIIQKNFKLVELLIYKIEVKSDVFECLHDIGSQILNLYGYFGSLELLEHFSELTNKEIIHQGIIKSITISENYDQIKFHYLKRYQQKTNSFLHLLQIHAVYEVFLGLNNKAKILRLDKTLNIQWAIDIKNELLN